MKDDIPDEIKKQRLAIAIKLFHEKQLERAKEEIGRFHLVLVNGVGKKPGQLKGKSDTFKTVIFDGGEMGWINSDTNRDDFGKSGAKQVEVGDYVLVKIEDCTSSSLFGKAMGFVEFKDFFEISGGRPFFNQSLNKFY